MVGTRRYWALDVDFERCRPTHDLGILTERHNVELFAILRKLVHGLYVGHPE